MKHACGSGANPSWRATSIRISTAPKRWRENGNTILMRWVRRIAVMVVGFAVLAIGIAMIVLPGPAIIVIPAGLGILGLEFAWARRWLRRIKEQGASILNKVRR